MVYPASNVFPLIILIKLSLQTKRIIKKNLFWAMDKLFCTTNIITFCKFTLNYFKTDVSLFWSKKANVLQVKY